MKITALIGFGILIFQHVVAAPNEEKPEDIAEVSPTVAEAEEKVDTEPVTLLDTPNEATAPQNQRQKRWYNYFGYPPVNPSIFNRDDSYNTGGFGLQDPLVHIHRRLQDINNSLRQPQPQFPPGFPQFPGAPQFPQASPQFPPGFPHFPAFLPVFYIPQAGCACTPDNQPQRPDNRPTPPSNNNNVNNTDPNVENRWPEMEDERQNWGLVTNDSDRTPNPQDDGDGSRPISFEPIRPNRPMSRPAPPVEHGSVEGDANSVNNGPTTTTTPQPAQAPTNSGLQPPSECDSAILRCCHLPQVTYDCFALQGCPDPSSYGYPCDNGVISRVIDRFLRFYAQRNG